MSFDAMGFGMSAAMTGLQAYASAQAIKEQTKVQVNAINNQMTLNQLSYDMNMLQADVYEQFTMLTAAIDERNFRQSIDRLRGETRANYSKAGVTMSGSALDVLQDITMSAERDALAIRYEAQMQASKYAIDAANAAIGNTNALMSQTASMASSSAGNSSSWITSLGSLAKAAASSYTPTSGGSTDSLRSHLSTSGTTSNAGLSFGEA